MTLDVWIAICDSCERNARAEANDCIAELHVVAVVVVDAENVDEHEEEKKEEEDDC